MHKNTLYRFTCFAGFLIAVGALATAYYLQYVENIEPCPMCMLQRVMFIVVGLVCLLAWLLVPAKIGRTIWAIVIVLLSAVGAYLAWRHVEIMNTPIENLLDSCSSLAIYKESDFWHYFFTETYTVVSEAIQGGTSCATKEYFPNLEGFKGLLLPIWALIGFAAIVVLALVGAFTKAPKRYFKSMT